MKSFFASAILALISASSVAAGLIPRDVIYPDVLQSIAITPSATPMYTTWASSDIETIFTSSYIEAETPLPEVPDYTDSGSEFDSIYSSIAIVMPGLTSESKNESVSVTKSESESISKPTPVEEYSTVNESSAVSGSATVVESSTVTKSNIQVTSTVYIGRCPM
ncbi:hypothetical protein GGF37_001953 [Kickxella alabastrina]|nr:hypothetical protein GGF37_001953 [Kickxella alabastrina]